MSAHSAGFGRYLEDRAYRLNGAECALFWHHTHQDPQTSSLWPSWLTSFAGDAVCTGIVVCGPPCSQEFCHLLVLMANWEDKYAYIAPSWRSYSVFLLAPCCLQGGTCALLLAQSSCVKGFVKQFVSWASQHKLRGDFILPLRNGCFFPCASGREGHNVSCTFDLNKGKLFLKAEN